MSRSDFIRIAIVRLVWNLVAPDGHLWFSLPTTCRLSQSVYRNYVKTCVMISRIVVKRSLPLQTTKSGVAKLICNKNSVSFKLNELNYLLATTDIRKPISEVVRQEMT
jgi:hypothetical protein